MDNLIAIVGRPNVGKSTLFNRLANSRIAIVDQVSHLTRDRIYHQTKWQNYDLNIIDTGGIEVKQKNKIYAQTMIAIEEAKIILLVVDGQQILNDDDLLIFNLLKKNQKKVILVANKMENHQPLDQSIWKLGLDIVQISALHKQGIEELLNKIKPYLEKSKKVTNSTNPKITILGQTNVGKSSLLNHLVQNQRAIVSSKMHTTRDPVKDHFKIDKTTFDIIDTAGLRRKSKLNDDWEYYVWLRTIENLQKSDIVLLVLDASKVVSNFDMRISGYALENAKPLIIVVNKIDLVSNLKKIEINLKQKFTFIAWVAIVFIAVKTNQNIELLKQKIIQINQTIKTKVSNHQINALLLELQTIKPANSYKGGRLKIINGTQIDAKIPTFVLAINNPLFLHFSYKRFIEKHFRKSFSLLEVPIKLIFRKKEK